MSKDRWAYWGLGAFVKDRKKEKQGRKVCGLLSERLGAVLSIVKPLQTLSLKAIMTARLDLVLKQ